MRRLLVSLMMLFTLGVAVLAPAVSIGNTAYAACDDGPILGITRWYRGLVTQGPNGSCQIQAPGNGSDSLAVFITKIVLNVIQAGLAIAAYVTVFFIIKGGFNYMTSAGSPDGMKNAKTTITNAVIGLVIVLLSAVIVNTIAGVL